MMKRSADTTILGLACIKTALRNIATAQIAMMTENHIALN